MGHCWALLSIVTFIFSFQKWGQWWNLNKQCIHSIYDEVWTSNPFSELYRSILDDEIQNVIAVVFIYNSKHILPLSPCHWVDFLNHQSMSKIVYSWLRVWVPGWSWMLKWWFLGSIGCVLVPGCYWMLECWFLGDSHHY